MSSLFAWVKQMLSAVGNPFTTQCGAVEPVATKHLSISLAVIHSLILLLQHRESFQLSLSQVHLLPPQLSVL